MAAPKILWVNVGSGGLPEASTSNFARLCDVLEIEARELFCSGAAADRDLVCFNFDYPEMAGLKLIPETKSRWPSLPILMLTLQSSADLALWALRARVFDLLVKPISAQDVGHCVQRIEAVLHARRSQSARRPSSIAPQIPPEARYRPRQGTASRLTVAVAHVNKHYVRHIPESEVARLCEMSPSRFCRQFKAEFGVTFVDYLSGYRLSLAKRLLGNPHMSVADIAAAVGFNDPSYFTRVFRKQEGVSPTDYRMSTRSSQVGAPEIDVGEAETGS